MHFDGKSTIYLFWILFQEERQMDGHNFYQSRKNILDFAEKKSL